MQFVKAHGAGNDFVLLEDLDDTLNLNAAFVAGVCDRHFGIGGDGLIRIVRARDADFFMDYYNADGEVAEMCGNGIRCLAKYVADRGLWSGDEMRVDTRDGVKRITVERDHDGKVVRARVDMGAPILERGSIPMTGDGDPLHEQLVVAGTNLVAACVSMGNPHAVVFRGRPLHRCVRDPGSGSRDQRDVSRQDQRRVCRGAERPRGSYACLGARRRGDAGVWHRRVRGRGGCEPPWVHRQERRDPPSRRDTRHRMDR
jgi:diaminopimelate epimerase